MSVNSSYKQNYKVIPQIRIFQDDISLKVLVAIKNLLGEGILIKPSKGRTVSTLAFSNKKAIFAVIRVCQENLLHGAKQLDFLDFCKGYELYINKAHLDPIGINELKLVVNGMNSRRN